MPINPIYRKNPDSAIASYDFYDLMSNTGYKTFHGICLLKPTATESYRLVSNSDNHSDYWKTKNSYNWKTNGSTIDIDFDMDILKSFILKGDVIINIPYSYIKAPAQDVTATWTIKIYKVSAGTEYQLGSTITKIVEVPTADGDGTWGLLGAVIPIGTTTLKRGDIFRLSVVVSDVLTGTINVYHEPTSLVVSATIKETDLKVSLPFQIDL